MNAEIKAKIAKATTDAVKRAVREFLKSDMAYEAINGETHAATEDFIPAGLSEDAEIQAEDELMDEVIEVTDEVMLAIDRAIREVQA